MPCANCVRPVLAGRLGLGRRTIAWDVIAKVGLDVKPPVGTRFGRIARRVNFLLVCRMGMFWRETPGDRAADLRQPGDNIARTCFELGTTALRSRRRAR